MKKGTRYSASIWRDAQGVIRIKIAKGAPKIDDGVAIIEILNGEDEQELMARAMRFAQERL